MKGAIGVGLSASGLSRAPTLVLLLLAFALRVFRLGEQNVWWDEGLAIWAVRKPLVETTLWTASDVHPPLFFWTLWPWVRWVGQSELAARYLTLVWGMLAVALAHALGRRLGGRPAGILALALVAVSPFMVWWSMELRMYMLASLAVLAAVYACVRWLVDDRPRWLAAYLAAALAAVYTVYLTGVAIAAINLAVLGAAALRWLSPRRYARWLAVQVLLVLLFLPWWRLAAARMKSWTAVETPARPDFVGRLWATLLATGVSTDIGQARTVQATLVFLLAIGIAVGVLVVRRSARARHDTALDKSRLPLVEGGDPVDDLPARMRRVGLGMLALFAIVPPLAIWVATQPRSLFYTPAVEARYFLPFAAPVFVLIACVLAGAWRRSRAAGGLLALAVFAPMLIHLPGYYAERRLRDELQTLVLAIWTQAEPGDAVLLVSGNRYPIFRYYYDRPWDLEGKQPSYVFPPESPPRWEDRPQVIEFPDRGSDPIGENDWQDRLAEIVNEHDRVWLAEVDAHLQDPDGRVEAWLDEHRTRVLSEGYGPNALHLFAKDDRAPEVTGVTSGMPGTRWFVTGFPPQEPDLSVTGLPVRDLLPGDTLNVTQFMPDPNDVVLVHRDAKLVQARRGVEASATGRSRTEIPITDRFPSGIYDLGAAQPDQPLDNSPLKIGRVRVRGTLPPSTIVTNPGGPVFGADFARLVRVGVTSERVAPGETIAVDLLWQREGGTGDLSDADPHAFVHLIGPLRPGAGDPMWAGQDGPPSSGDWRDFTHAAQAIFDRHVLTLDPAAPPGEYQIEVGLYDPETGERYPVSGVGADEANRRVVVGVVRVE